MQLITRWVNTQTRREVACPRCKVEPNAFCVTPKGRKVDVHIERSLVYITKIGRNEYDRRHMGFPGKVWDSDIEGSTPCQ